MECCCAIASRYVTSEYNRVRMGFQDIVERIRPAIVGLGVLSDPEDELSVYILGTGFVVHPSGWIMTNWHVVEEFKGERDGVIGVRNAISRAVLFISAAGREIGQTGKIAVGGFGALPCPVVEIAWPPGALGNRPHYGAAPDLALCRINTETLEQFGLAQLPCLTLGDSSKVRAGDDVAICGFPLGLELPHDDKLHQATPIVQRGIVAAVLPFPGDDNPHAFQLDINVNPGSSGSPVFLSETGEVIGVVFAAPVDPHFITIPTSDGQQQMEAIRLPTGFGYAVPSNRFRNQPPPVIRLPDVYH